MKKSALILALSLSSSAFAMNSTETVVCYDNVSSKTYEVTLVDAGDKQAYVRIDGSLVYPPQQVAFDQSQSYISVAMYETGFSRLAESLRIPSSIDYVGHASGTYMDGGDSRTVSCLIKN